MSVAIHRLIEQRVAMHGDAPALVDGVQTLTYRDLNERANRVARFLMANGLRRGSLVLVRMRRSCDLAVILLAILKAGAYYAWTEDNVGETGLPCALSLAGECTENEQKFLVVDVTQPLKSDARSPNLPVLTRSTDIACLLPDVDGAPALLVPHATIASLLSAAVAARGKWSGEPGAFDLWIGLTAGATVSVVGQPAHSAAA